MGRNLLVALVGMVATYAASSTASGETFACSDGVEVHIGSSIPVQGQLMMVEIEGDPRLSLVRAGWGGQDLHFWKEGDTTYRALLGVDLEKKPRSFVLTVSASLADGNHVACGIPLSVRKGEFTVERLNVDRQYVELSQEDLERSRRDARRLRGIFRTVTPEKLWDGPFQPPLSDFDGSGNFGKRRIFNGEPRSPHSGEDFSAPAGTPIRAPQSGRVAFAEETFFSGNVVVIDHGLGLYTFHGHMQSIAVEAGQMVETGTILGRVGATGRVTGPHLHWTVRLGDARINPRDLLKVP